ncbi:urease accessory protein UreE [Terrarubrum flagellatum]|uniref:urease accessory protein UreE n=1 Tax=Terrirubrum flagellatum TaxID=2895980 RepID=UPI003144E65B
MPESAHAIVRKPAVKDDRIVDQVTLDHDAREDHHRDVVTEKGLNIHIHLHGVGALKDGDALKLDDGRLIRVKAADEKLYEIKVENPARLARLAWRLGGEHAPMEATADALYVPASPHYDELIRGAGANFTAVTRPFEPERATHHHHHNHDHHHGHDHHDHHDHGHKHPDHDHHDHKHDHHAHGHDHHHSEHKR